MGGVVIGKDIVKTTERINIDGIPINPKTKKPLHPIEKEYIPPPPHVLEAWKKEADEKREKESGGLEEIVVEKLGEKISGVIEKAIAKIDIGDMVEKALDKALTKK